MEREWKGKKDREGIKKGVSERRGGQVRVREQKRDWRRKEERE